MKTKRDLVSETLEQLKRCSDMNVEPSIELIKLGCLFCGLTFSEPYSQWDYRHVITCTGGVVPFSLAYLLEKMEAIPKLNEA